MSWVNYDDVRRQLDSVCLILDKELSLDARIQRWKTADSKGGEKPGWSRLKEWESKAGNVYIVGCFGVWQGNDDGKTQIELPRRDDPNGPALTDEDMAAARAAAKAAQQAIVEERKREAKIAAGWAAQVWAKCQPVENHEYLTRKQIKACGTRVWNGSDELRLTGIDEANHWRLMKSIGALVVPMHDINGSVVGIQFIFPKGHEFENKQFWPTGMAMGGSFGVIGGWRRSGILLLCEGFATAATLHEASTQPVAYAFSANNMGKAAKSIRSKYKQLRILLCADDDYLTAEKTGKNPGVDAAHLAASEIESAAWLAPDFRDESGSDLRNGRKLTDFNDLHMLSGSPLAVANQINFKLDALKWRDARPVSAGQLIQGGGGNRAAIPSMLQIDEALERFVMVYGGKGTLFDNAEHMLVPKSDVLDILPEHGWRDMRAHKRVARIDEVGFDPACTDKKITCNLWGGWPTVPKAGKCSVLLSLLEYLCSEEENNHEVYLWVLRWLAYPIQNPGAKMRTALVFHGPQGAGKNLFFETVMGIYGEYGRIVDQAAIEDKFNDWGSRKLFLIADEVVAQAELYHVKNKLKSFVTGEWIRINPKNVAAHDERNHVNLVFLSNEHKPLQLDRDDRRYTVVWTPEKLPETYYSAVRDELDNGGMAALHDYLLNLDMEGFSEHSKPPMTGSKRDLIDVSLGSVERFVRDWEAGETPWPFCPCYRSDLYMAYTRWCRTDGVNKPREAAQFYGHIAKLPGWEAKPKDRFESTHYSGKMITQRMVVPSVSALEESTRNSTKDYRRPQGKTQAQWLTDCFFDFNNALGVEK